MKCYRPLRISNKKLAYKDGYDKPSLFVPCGTCEACRSNQQNDWTIRAYFHWLYYIKVLNGRVLFITLTYRQNDNEYGNKTVPERCFYRIDPITRKRKRVTFTCFDKNHIDTYINSIRKYFRRKYGVGKNSSSTSINYLVTCEYGSKNTFAPHYHCAIYFPNCDASDKEIKDVCSRLWSHGFTLYSLENKGGAFIKNTYGIKYVAKYCCKDLDFYGKSEVKECISNKIRKDRLKKNLPRHWQSNGFGSYMALYDVVLKDPFDCLTTGVRMLYDTYKYSVPIYVRNKLLFDIYYLRDEEGNILHTLKKLSDYGYSLSDGLYDLNLKHCSTSIDNDISLLGLQKYIINHDDLKSWYQDYFNSPIPLGYSLVDLYRYLKDLKGPYSSSDIAKYSLVFRGYSDSKLTAYYWTLKELLDDSKNIYLYRMDDSRYYLSLSDLHQPDLLQRSKNNFLLNRFPDLQNFENILLILDSLKCRLNKRRSIARYEDFINRKKLKQKFIYTV